MSTTNGKLEQIRLAVEASSNTKLKAELVDILAQPDSIGDGLEGQELVNAALEEVDATVKRITALFGPDDKVTAWVLTTTRVHGDDTYPVVGTIVPIGQSHILTRGILEHAVDLERSRT